MAAAGFPFYLGTLYMISYFSLGASIVFGFASAVQYALFYLMSLAGPGRYVRAATTFLALFVNAAVLAIGYWSRNQLLLQLSALASVRAALQPPLEKRCAFGAGNYLTYRYH